MLVSAGTATGGGRAMPTSTTVRNTKKGDKGRKNEQKHRPRHLATMANNGDASEEVENSDKEFMAMAEHDSKWHT
jgi:hypothetical protein